MPFVYRDTDRDDGKVKYVGIIKKDSNFPGRFAGHKSDDWADKGRWKIEYFRVLTQSDAEMLEAHLIAKYGTYNFYNKSKGNWGLCSYAPKEKDLQWQEYKDFPDRITTHGDVSWRIECIRRDMDELYDELDKLRDSLTDIHQKFTESRRASIRAWVLARTEPACNRKNCKMCHDIRNCVFETSIEDCFENYQKYEAWAAHSKERVFKFIDTQDFMLALEDTWETKNYIKGDKLRLGLTTSREVEEAC